MNRIERAEIWVRKSTRDAIKAEARRQTVKKGYNVSSGQVIDSLAKQFKGEE